MFIYPNKDSVRGHDMSWITGMGLQPTWWNCLFMYDGRMPSRQQGGIGFVIELRKQRSFGQQEKESQSTI